MLKKVFNSATQGLQGTSQFSTSLGAECLVKHVPCTNINEGNFTKSFVHEHLELWAGVNGFTSCLMDGGMDYSLLGVAILRVRYSEGVATISVSNYDV